MEGTYYYNISAYTGLDGFSGWAPPEPFWTRDGYWIMSRRDLSAHLTRVLAERYPDPLPAMRLVALVEMTASLGARRAADQGVRGQVVDNAVYGRESTGRAG